MRRPVTRFGPMGRAHQRVARPSASPAAGVPLRRMSVALLLLTSIAGCADTEVDDPVCEPGTYQCVGSVALKCSSGGAGWAVESDCAQQSLICTTRGCRTCEPASLDCVGQDLLRCRDDGSSYLPEPVITCDASAGMMCDGTGCTNACELAQQNRSYVGCEYWAVDLDNAVVRTGNAAAQQFAVALSNPTTLSAEVVVEIDAASPGQPAALQEVVRRTVRPQALEVLLLPAREVDGSAPGQPNSGGGTAITRGAYRITSSAPLIVYQFNPLSNVGVFSNDASLLVPTSALTVGSTADSQSTYLVMGWPQTIASTTDPKTNFGDDLRAFLTVVGTRDGTTVRVFLSTAIVGDLEGRVGPRAAGEILDVELDAFEVLNLETGDFGADFTGTRVEADKAVVVFSGSEASDVPDFPDLTTRKCCADHLEEQLFPLPTFGTTFIALTTPSRSQALKDAGAIITPSPETEYFRVLATGEFTAVTTNLPPPNDQLMIEGTGLAQIAADQDFTLQGSDALVLGQFVASQQDAGIPSTLPGGDPSFILLPPVEQFRTDYLFLTPDKYAFDFIMVAAPEGTKVTLDGRLLKEGDLDAPGQRVRCTHQPVGAVTHPNQTVATTYYAYKCQLSFPVLDPTQQPPDNLLPGQQNDGVHRLTADQPVGLVVYGFDSYVSYGYPGGTDLTLINLQ